MATATVSVGAIPEPPQQPEPQVRFLTRWDRMREALIGCRNHDWGFPVTVKGMKALYQAPYNSHQACTQCGRMRMFDSKTMTPGPMFERK